MLNSITLRSAEFNIVTPVIVLLVEIRVAHFLPMVVVHFLQSSVRFYCQALMLRNRFCGMPGSL